MTEKQLWLSSRDPVRNSRSGYEFDGDCGLDSLIIETDKEITAGLDEEQAQAKLRELRPRIQAAARMRHRMEDAYLEQKGWDKERYRIAITAEDLAAASL